MDDDFDDFTTNIGGDDLLDFELETQFRSRAYTWPSRPPSFPSPVVHPETNLEQSQLTSLTDVTEAEVKQLYSLNDSNHNLDLPPSPGGVGAVRKVASRRNAWGNLSYADLISKAIESAPEKRLTLSQIYSWMVVNVPFFSDKGDSNSSAGWKNSIRHNLSLHSRFVRVQNEGTGKSSWWMLSSDDVPKAPRKRAGTMDAVSNYRRPGKLGKQLSGRPLKSARSIELHPGGSETAIPSEELRNSFGAVPTLNEPTSASSACGKSHSFREYRNRSHSGESSVGSGCSPKFEPGAPGNWDTSYLSPEPIGLADVFTGVTSSSCHQQPQSLYQHHQQHPNNHQLAQNRQLQHNEQLQGKQQQQHAIFRPNEAYAHGVPIHRSGISMQHDTGVSPTGLTLTPGVNYQSSGGNLMMGADTTNKQQHVPILSNLLHEKPRSSCVHGSLLLSGGNMSLQELTPGIVPSIGADVTALLPTETAAHATTHVAQQHQQPVRRPSQMNQRLLMQLLANKPHLAARVQQLIEGKRRQQMATAANASLQTSILTSHVQSEPTSMASHNAMIEHFLNGITSSEEPLTMWNGPHLPAYDESFPNDLDLNLLDFETTSDIDCDIEQVIQHELAFGDKLDFTFDQLHLDEFASYP